MKNKEPSAGALRAAARIDEAIGDTMGYVHSSKFIEKIGSIIDEETGLKELVKALEIAKERLIEFLLLTFHFFGSRAALAIIQAGECPSTPPHQQSSSRKTGRFIISTEWCFCASKAFLNVSFSAWRDLL